MAWDRDERYASAGAMQHDLERYLTATGTNVSAREVGGCVTELFREDRANTNGVIEAHVARARGGAARDKLPIIDVASRQGVGSPTPSYERHATNQPTEAGQETSLDVPSAKQPGVPSLAPSEPRGITRTGHKLIIPGVAIAGAIALIIFFVARSSQEAGMGARADNGPRTAIAQPVAPQPTPPVPVPTTPPLPTTRTPDPAPPVARPKVVDIEIRVSPDTARISIDGREIGGGSFVRQVVIDDVIHHIRAVAPGYLAKSVEVPFAADVTLDMNLERTSPSRPVARVAPPVRTPPAHPSEPHPADPAHPTDPSPVRQPSPDPGPVTDPKPAGQPADVDPAGGIKPRRPIDPNNPYGGRE